MKISEKLEALPNDHPDFDWLVHYQELVDGLFMYSEAQYPYHVFIWNSAREGELLNDNLFQFMVVVEKLFGEIQPITESNLIQAKHRANFEFEGNRLVNKKPQKFYRDKYRAWNRFVGRIYTEDGVLTEDEIHKMRRFAQEIWTLQLNPIQIFEFNSPIIHHFLMGRTECGNWLGVHTMSVET